MVLVGKEHKRLVVSDTDCTGCTGCTDYFDCTDCTVESVDSGAVRSGGEVGVGACSTVAWRVGLPISTAVVVVVFLQRLQLFPIKLQRSIGVLP